MNSLQTFESPDKMVVHPITKPLMLTFAGVAAAEGILWFIGGIIGILVQQNVVTFSSSNAEKYIPLILYEFDKYCVSEDEGTLPLVYFVFQLIFSGALFGLSAYICWVLVHEKWKLLKNILIGWTVVMGLTCILDLCFSIAFGVDYGDAVSKFNLNIDQSAKIVMLETFLTLVARGYVLWIFNVAAVVASVLLILQFIKEEKELSLYNQSVKPIHAFAPKRSESFLEVSNEGDRKPTIAQINAGYVNDEEDFQVDPSLFDDQNSRHNYNEGYPYNPSYVVNYNYNYPPSSPVYKEDREREYLPPPPRVPTPDYTPPDSPVVRARPVLKTTSNYG